MIYLFEPILVGTVMVAMIYLFPSTSPERDCRLMELHAQDVLAIIQKEGIESARENLELLKLLNQNYKYHFESGETEIGDLCDFNCVSVERIDIKNSRKMRLTIWI